MISTDDYTQTISPITEGNLPNRKGNLIAHGSADFSETLLDKREEICDLCLIN